MKVRLKILHGTLQNAHGHQAVQDVKVRGPRFVIGGADDCSMCCRSDSVLPHHCELLVDQQRAIIRPLSDQAATFVNGQPVELEQTLQSGDKLRIGRLDFEVLITEDTAAVKTEPRAESEAVPEPERDPAAEELSDLLAQADERERLERQEHPELRVMHLEAEGKPAAPQADEAAELEEAAKHKRHKKKPGKLPTRPPKDEITGEDSTDAAQQALRKLFSR
jgi:predicted component of type VI protein secretion system